MTAAEKRSLLKKAELFLNGEQFRPFLQKSSGGAPLRLDEAAPPL